MLLLAATAAGYRLAPGQRHVRVSIGHPRLPGPSALERFGISLQKPLGLVLEDREAAPGVFVADIKGSGSASGSGVQAGDVLLMVGVTDVSALDVDAVVALINEVPYEVTLELSRETEAVAPPPKAGGVIPNLGNSLSALFRPEARAADAGVGGNDAGTLTADALQERIALLRQRERALEQIIKDEEGPKAAAAEEEEEEEEAEYEDDAYEDDAYEDDAYEDDDEDDDADEYDDDDDASSTAAQRFTIRLPATVQPLQRCAAVLPNGIRVEFTAPADASPGMLVNVATSQSSATDRSDATSEDDRGGGGEEEEQEEEEEEEEEVELEEEAEAIGSAEPVEQEDASELSSIQMVTTQAILPKDRSKASADAVDAVVSPKKEAASKALTEGDIGKALLTSIFGESKADRQVSLQGWLASNGRALVNVGGRFSTWAGGFDCGHMRAVGVRCGCGRAV